MIVPALHPGRRTLVAYATRSLSDRQRTRVATHILRCAQCRSEAEATAFVANAAADIGGAVCPDEVLARVIAARAANERRILPVEAPAIRRRFRWWTVAAPAAAAVLLVLVVTTPPAMHASASAGVLRLDPAVSAPGGVVQVHYEPPASFFSSDSLHLRAHWRRADPSGDARTGEPHVVAILTPRDGETAYNGSFRVPEAAVYGVFVVEDSRGQRVDHNTGRRWELLTSRDSVPSLDALRAQWTEHERTKFRAAYEVTTQATTLYATRAEPWLIRQGYEAALFTGREADSLRALHVANLARLHPLLRSPARLEATEAGSMYWYSQKLGDTAKAEYWRRRVLRDHPGSKVGIQLRMIHAFGLHWQSAPRVALDSLERLWSEARVARALITQQGVILARRIGDPVLIVRWADRDALETPSQMAANALGMMTVSELHNEGLRRLRQLVQRATPRPLEHTMDEYAASTRDHRGQRLFDLGKALRLAGQQAAAADTLWQAGELIWSAELFDEAREALLVVGDSSRALEMAARLVVDRSTPVELRHRLTAAGRTDSLRWFRLLEQSRRLVRQRTLERADRRRLDGDIRLHTPDGNATSLMNVLGDQPAVVTFLSRYCGYSLQELPELSAFAARMEAQGVRIIAITSDPLNSKLVDLMREKRVSVPLYHDLRGEANDAFQSWETPTYFVVDGARQVIFSRTRRAHIPRQIDALRPPS